MTMEKFAGSLGAICALALIVASLRMGHPLDGVWAFVVVLVLAQFESLIRIVQRKQSFVAPGRKLVLAPRTEAWLQVWFYGLGIAYAAICLALPHVAWPHVGALPKGLLAAIFVAAPIAVAVARIARQPRVG